MARFNQFSGRSPSTRNFAATGLIDRRASLEARGIDVANIMQERGIGVRRAMAVAERTHNLVWRAGGFGDEVRGHASV